ARWSMLRRGEPNAPGLPTHCLLSLERVPRRRMTASLVTGSAYTSSSPARRWLQRALLIDDRKGWRDRARESIVDLNDGIVSAAGIAEGFAAAGASTRALVFAGATVVVTGGVAPGRRRFRRGTEPQGR